MMVTTLIVIGILLGATPSQPTKKAYPDLFEACKYRYTDEQQKEKTLTYHLFVPRSFQPTERYPMMVWPVFGDWLNALVLNDVDHIEKYRFFILVIASTDKFDEILCGIVNKYPVNQDRVCLAGPSKGGSICWELSVFHPELFAAVVPMAGGRADTSRAFKLVNTPIWAFHSRDETYVPRAGTEEMVAAVKKAGGNIHLTLPPSTSHDCWTTAFKQYNILEWLFAQRRGSRICWVPPGTQPWKWWHILTEPFLFLSIVCTGWYFERRRRVRKRQRVASLPCDYGWHEQHNGLSDTSEPGQWTLSPGVLDRNVDFL